MVKHIKELTKVKGFDELKHSSKHTIIEVEDRATKIKKLLGDNFIGMRRCGNKIELLTATDINPATKKSIEKIWSSEE